MEDMAGDYELRSRGPPTLDHHAPDIWCPTKGDGSLSRETEIALHISPISIRHLMRHEFESFIFYELEIE
jgi:hypothetical protein